MKFLNLTANERKIIFLSSLGGALEFYDFIIYVIFAQPIAQIFFPQTDKFASLISVYAIFAVGYLVRPLGGIILSHFGDKYGRKTTFIVSVMMMAVPTFMIGLLPTYQYAGIMASVALVVMRIVQGLSVGGEIPGALTFTYEHVNQNSSGLACGIIFACLNLGILLGAIISLILMNIFSNEQILSFGWRIPFLFGGILGVVSFYIRKQMTESPLFISFKNQGLARRIPLVEAVTLHWKKILQGTGITLLGAVVINLLFLYMPTYLSKILNYPREQATLFNTINLCFYSSLLVFFCWYADKLDRRKILLIGSSGFVFFGYMIFWILSHQTTWALLTGMFIIAILSSFIMIFSGILVELFPVSIRYTGVAISYNVAFAFFGGLTPLIATYLVQSTKNILSPGFYLIFSAMLCTIAGITIKKSQEFVHKNKIKN